MVGVLGIGVAAATWPGDEPQTAYPAPAVSQPAAAIASPSTAYEPNFRRSATPTPTAKASRKASAKPKVTTKAKPVAKPKPKPAPTPPLKVVDSKYVTASLNVRTAPSFESDVVDVVSTGDKVSVTSAIYNGFRFISYNDRGRWISNKYLSDKKPAVQSSGAAAAAAAGSRPPRAPRAPRSSRAWSRTPSRCTGLCAPATRRSAHSAVGGRVTAASTAPAGPST